MLQSFDADVLAPGRTGLRLRPASQAALGNTRIPDAAAGAALRWWLGSCVVAVAVVMALKVHSSAQIREQHALRAAGVAIARELDREARALEAQLVVLEGDERIEAIAREQLGMVRPAPGQRRLLR